MGQALQDNGSTSFILRIRGLGLHSFRHIDAVEAADGGHDVRLLGIFGKGVHLSMTSEFVRMWAPGRLPIFKLLSRSARRAKTWPSLLISPSHNSCRLHLSQTAQQQESSQQ